VWERREARAADRVNVPLLGDLPTREAAVPLTQGNPTSSPSAAPAADPPTGDAGTDGEAQS
jgi:hypothetical protein